MCHNPSCDPTTLLVPFRGGVGWGREKLRNEERKEEVRVQRREERDEPSRVNV